MQTTLYDVRKYLGMPRASLLEHLSLSKVRTMEAKSCLDLTLTDLEHYVKAFGMTPDEFIQAYIIKDWPKHKIRFWEITGTSYKLSAEKTHQMLKIVMLNESIPSYPTLHRWLNTEQRGYNLIPLRYLIAVHRRRIR